MERRIDRCKSCSAEIDNTATRPGRPKEYCNPAHRDRARKKRLREQARAYREMMRALEEVKAA